MTKEREKELRLGISDSLTDEEIKDGWFFCCEFDGDLMNKSDYMSKHCDCIRINK